jgi:hypothetical protein
MDIKKLIAIKDEGEFKDKLGKELEADFECLPLEEGCRDGGFPNGESVYVHNVEKTGENADYICANFSVSFSEAFNTSCADCIVEKQRDMDCSIVIDKLMEEVEISVNEIGYEPEF